MLDQVQRRFFDENGYLIVPDVVGKPMLETVRQEYADLLDDLYAGWHADGLVSAEPDGPLLLGETRPVLQGRFRLVSATRHQPPAQRYP